MLARPRVACGLGSGRARSTRGRVDADRAPASSREEPAGAIGSDAGSASVVVMAQCQRTVAGGSSVTVSTHFDAEDRLNSSRALGGRFYETVPCWSGVETLM